MGLPADSVIFTKVEHQFVQVGIPFAYPSKRVFFIRSPEGDVCGPLDFDDCRRRFPDFAAGEGSYELVERNGPGNPC